MSEHLGRLFCRPGKPLHELVYYPSGVSVCSQCRVVVEFPGRPGEAPSETWARWRDAVRAAQTVGAEPDVDG